MALHWRLVGERLGHAKRALQARQLAALVAVLACYRKVFAAYCRNKEQLIEWLRHCQSAT
jgi:hypothetical protein